jgi:hypothetical protein
MNIMGVSSLTISNGLSWVKSWVWAAMFPINRVVPWHHSAAVVEAGKTRKSERNTQKNNEIASS